MSLQLELIFNGVIAGCIYVLFTSGFTLLYGTFKIVNLAHGSFLVVGGFVGVYLDNMLEAPLIVSAIVAAVAAGLVTVVMDFLVVRPSNRAAGAHGFVGSDFAPLVVTLAFGTIVTGLLTTFVGHEAYAYHRVDWFLAPAFGFASRLDIAILLLTAVLGLALNFAINKTRGGSKIRAVAEDRVMAAALGIRSGQVSAVTFFFAGALAGFAGVVIGIKYSNVNVAIGDVFLLVAFVVAIVGGLGSIAGTTFAAFAIGILQQVGGAYLSQPMVNLIIYGVLLVTLLIRPSGLLGRRSTTHGVTRV